MQKAQAEAIFGLAVAVIVCMVSVMIISNQVGPLCEAQPHCENTNLTNTAYTAMNYSDLEVGSMVIRHNCTTCTTALAGGCFLYETGNYTVNSTDGGVIKLNGLYNTSLYFETYDYYEPGYIGGITCTVIDNTALLMAIGAIVLIAGGWMATR